VHLDPAVLPFLLIFFLHEQLIVDEFQVF
jgi:hypothetical protein